MVDRLQSGVSQLYLANCNSNAGQQDCAFICVLFTKEKRRKITAICKKELFITDSVWGENNKTKENDYANLTNIPQNLTIIILKNFKTVF